MSTVYNLNIFFQAKDKPQLLEPLTCIIRLALLYFEKKGTKIAINNNRVHSQSPTLLQGTIRWTYGNKRNKLHNLHKPMLIATHYYNSDKNEHIKTIFSYAIKGLEKLNNT